MERYITGIFLCCIFLLTLKKRSYINNSIAYVDIYSDASCSGTPVVISYTNGVCQNNDDGTSDKANWSSASSLSIPRILVIAAALVSLKTML
jgi:hypothetical protein